MKHALHACTGDIEDSISNSKIKHTKAGNFPLIVKKELMFKST